jgi:tRNA 2-thiocytidine biosynthesis protein TtcA
VSSTDPGATPPDRVPVTRASHADRLTFFLLKGVNRAVREFGLIAEGDRIAVAVSGGKDSCALVHLLQARQRSAAEHYQIVAVHIQMHPAGLPDLRPTLEPWLARLGVEYAFAPLALPPDEPLPLSCDRCAHHRRRTLFFQARALGCNKVALAHHADDAAETTLLNLLQLGRLETLAPARRYFDGAFTVIRPLILVEERRLAQLARALEAPADVPACPQALSSRRAWVRRWLADAGRDRRQMRANLWRVARRHSKAFT